MNDSWHSYPKIYNIGHKALTTLFLDPVTVEEKVDGSQFSFGVYLNENGEKELRVRSKGAMLYTDAPEHLFKPAVEYVKSIQDRLVVGWRYIGETLRSKKHNTLIYDRAPDNYIIIFDICIGEEAYLPYEEKFAAAQDIGLETVPLLHKGMIHNIEEFRELLDRKSILGGSSIEGFVIKNYEKFGPDGKALMGKFVSEKFREVHCKAWKESNPSVHDAVARIAAKYQTQARWHKAVQHLREAGQLLEEPKDIGKLIVEIRKDIGQECKEEIKEQLWKAFQDKFMRICTAGMPEWYKDDYLVKLQFERQENE